MIFHERLTQLRKEGWPSQKECAKALGVDPSKYNKWENGKNCPDFETVCNLAKFFETTTDYLFGLSDKRYIKNVREEQWQSKLSDRINDLLDKFFIEYESYSKTEDSLDYKELFLSVIGWGFQKVINPNIELLEDLKKLPTSNACEVDLIIGKYHSRLNSILYKEVQNEDGMYITDVSVIQLVELLRRKIEANYPNYRKFRREFLDEWAKKLSL